MTDVPIENNVIYLEISSTLTAVNAHFETNVFADVRVYADEAKTYALKPAVTYHTTVNNRGLRFVLSVWAPHVRYLTSMLM